MLNVAETLADVGDFILYEYLKAPLDHADGLRAWKTAGWHDVTASFAKDRNTAVSDAARAIVATLYPAGASK